MNGEAKRWLRWAVGAVGILVLGLRDRPAWAAETRAVVAGSRYKAGALHRFFLGSGYRELWAEPIEVEVLDLATWSGGLVAEKKGGGKQTSSLKLDGKDGREWKFRSIDKDPTAVLPEGLRDTLASRLTQDQIGASHPGGALVVDALAEAAGIPHVAHRIVLLPDDERLGPFRREFAGMLGTLEEDASVEDPVTPGFSGFDRLVDSDELERLLDADSSERVDSRSYLRARLLDFLIGDSDRHRKQWDWARDTGTGRFVAVPKDRDLAFVRFDGLLLSLVRPRAPQLVAFDLEYPEPVCLLWQSRFLDRRHLADLEWPAWRQTAEELQARLPDATIDAAASRLPLPYFRLSGAALAARLKARRSGLPGVARRFYELLAREAEVHGTDGADSLQLTRQADGSVVVVLGGRTGPYFRRHYLPAETEEVRVFLKGGDDRAVSEGTGPARVTVRLVGGEGNDVFDDSGAGDSRVYDASGDNRVAKGRGTSFSDRPYVPPVDDRGNPERDWGSKSQLVPWLRANEDYGLVIGARFDRKGFGFRKHPYAEHHSVRLGYSTGLETGGVEYAYDSLRTDGRSRFEVTARLSALDIIHFYGFGNETSDAGEPGSYDVAQTQYHLAPSYRLELDALDVSLGPILEYADTRNASNTLLGEQQPYGADRFGQVGARLRIAVDRRQLAGGRSRGGMLALEGAVYPALWSVTETFATLRAQGTWFLTADVPLETTLAVRGGGQRLFGRYPFHEAASLGGSESLRGLLRQRYAGDASAYANAELRLLLVRRERALVPRFGAVGLFDVGRVFLAGESSGLWHTAVGGGVFVSVAEPDNVLSVVLASSEGSLRFYLQGGFGF